MSVARAPRPARETAARTTGRLVDLVLGTRYEDLPQAAVHAAKRLILDTIAVTIAAFDTPAARALVKLKRDQGGRGEATLMVEGARLPAQSTAFVHAQLANLLDADETLLNRTHTVSANVMPGLALAERLGIGGRELIAAIATGYDVTSRIGLSLRQYMSNDQGGTVFAPLFGFSWMSLGAAATSGRLIGLDRTALARALGQAFVMTPIHFDIPRQNRPFYRQGEPANWHKYQMPGTAAEAGINAAFMAAEGWIAQDDLFDEGSEFWRSFGALGCNWDLLYAERGERWYIAESSIKPYPFCRFGHAGLDLFGGIMRDEGLAAGDIDQVVVRIPPLRQLEELAENAIIDDPLKLMVSLPTALALVALGVPPGPRWFSADYADPALRRFIAKIGCETEPAWANVLADQIRADGFFRRAPTEIVVRAGGREYRRSAEYALGDPWAPGHAMSDEQLVAKVHRFTEGILPRDKADALIESVFALDRASDVGAVMAATVRQG